MSMPNWVPQSPMWFSLCEEDSPAHLSPPHSSFPSPHLNTSWPRNSSSRESVSPIMVERRCPTCISLAMLGEEKSITTRSFLGTAGGRTPLTSRSVTRDET